MQSFAERFVEQIRLSGFAADPLHVSIDNWELADRPSLRLIARIIMVARFDNFSISWEFKSIGSREDIKRPESPWRRLFLSNFSAYTGTCAEVSQSPMPALCADIGTATTALVDMNWDLLIPSPGYPGTPNVQLRLQYALALANVGANAESLEIITKILNKDSLSKEFRAHLHYLKGLLQTKRFRESRAALDTFGQGIAALRDPASEAGAVILGWLKNGAALAKCTLYLSTTSADSAERTRSMMEIFEEEAQVYHDLEGNHEASYLRYNILANMGFLLELAHDLKSALQFWSSAFPGISADALSYRKGILQMKAGLHADSADSLGEALENSQRSGNVFYAAQESYALAYLSATTGKQNNAYLKQGYKYAARLGDLNLTKKFDKLSGVSLGQRPDFPSSKLNSYVPYAELDSEEGSVENFNTVLLSSGKNVSA
jgi:hypothetical protein